MLFSGRALNETSGCTRTYDFRLYRLKELLPVLDDRNPYVLVLSYGKEANRL
jgi:hypothetical protein